MLSKLMSDTGGLSERCWDYHVQVHVMVVARTGLVAAHEPYCSLQARLSYMGVFADHQLEALPGADAVGWPGRGLHSRFLG